MKNNRRLLIACLASITIHAIIITALYLNQIPQFTPQNKVKLENLLVLKRGHSTDPSKDKEGARKPSLASQNSITPPSPQTNQIKQANQKQSHHQTQKPLNQNQEQTQKQQDSQKKSLETYQPDHFDPRNLSLINQSQQSSIASLPQQYANENDKGRDPQTIQEIHELYGEEFGDLGTAQKNFIKNNLRNIGRITQSYLKYPQVAAYFEQSGVNAVEFYLHPNGDITDLKIIKSSGLHSFDSGTLNTIKIAYKDYPRPTEKTLIKIHVTYSYWGF